MLSIANVSAHQASTYYEKDDYYVRVDNDDDRWQGKLQQELGLPDNVNRDDFNKFINENKERAGFDLSFNAPKSVSVAALCTDEATRQIMIEAHNAAVTATLQQIEAREIGTRVTKNKVTEHVKTGNMLCGKFNHFVNRNHDPQLHTHAVILNKTLYNGKWYAVDNPDLYNNKIEYGQIYRTTLASELMSRGCELTVTDAAQGFFELKGIDQEILHQFSSRRAEIVEKLREWGTNTPEAASKAAILTRQAKEHKDMNTLQQSWRETIKEMGFGELTHTRATGPILQTKQQRKIDFEQAIKRISHKSFAFTEKQLKRAVLAAGVASGMTEADYERLLKSELGKTLISLGLRQDKKDGHVYYTTKRNMEIEKEIFHEVARTKGTMAGVDKTKAAEFLIQALESDQAPLSEQQFNAVTHIAATRDKYLAIQGLAGTGKTHMLNYARQVLENNGYTVRGACFTGKAAEGLQTDAKIPSGTIHSFLNRLEREAGNRKPGEDMQNKTEWNLKGLKPGATKEAWIVDEASMVENGLMRHLMTAAEAKGSKVVFVGDRHQLLPIGVGNAFAVLTEEGKISTVVLDEIRRQREAELLKSVYEAVGGDISKCFELIDGDVQVIAKHRERMNAIVKEYTSLEPDQQKSTMVLTAENKDRKLLNKIIRKELQKQGHLATGTVFTVEDAKGNASRREFSPEDKIIFLQNDMRLCVMNGQTGIIEKIDGSILTIKTGEKTLAIDVNKFKKIDHAYAMTTHKAEGITIDRVLINMDSSQGHLNNRNAFYVDLSRARYKVKVFMDNKAKVEEQVTEFAKKLTSKDFLPPETGKKSFANRMNDAMEDFFKTLKEFKITHKPEGPQEVKKHNFKL